MSKTQPEKTELNRDSFGTSPALAKLLGSKHLTDKQKHAIPLIVKQRINGDAQEWLFNKENPNRLNRSTVMDKWFKNPLFVAAVDMAEEEARSVVVQNVVLDTVDRLRRLAPLAADDLERQIIGDDHALDALMRVSSNGKRPNEERHAAIQSMGSIGTRRATDLLILLLDDADPTIRQRAAEALGRSAAGLNASRRLADTAVLDRADKETANKGGDAQGAEDIEEIGARRWQQIAPLLAQMQESDAAFAPPAISS